MPLSSPHKLNVYAVRVLLMALVAFTLATPPAKAQTAGTIKIGGKVYGGGKEGAILSGNTTSNNTTAIEAVEITDKEFRTSDAAQASQVTIHDGTIVGVFGGGEQGRAYGKTNVTVYNGSIGIGTVNPDSIRALPEATRLVNGNVFGAGDGEKAAVFGGSNVTVIGGRINGSVYGGGNEADLVGCSELTLQGGIYVGAVYGGARKSNIYGYTYVNIDGLNAKNTLHIIDVYGGNDIAGTIQPDERWSWTRQSFLQVPFELANNTKIQHLTTSPANHVDNRWNAFILATEDQSANHYRTLIDNLYGGGNGDYDYTTSKIVDGKETNLNLGLSKPVIDRTYMQLEGGAYGSVYGGGNAATVVKSTDICLFNSTTVNTDYLRPLDGTDSAPLYTASYQFNRVFGGNNKEPMAIRPNWYLEKASVNNLYSGGNAGAMTYYNAADAASPKGGIILALESADMRVNNVYGGCRMADVNPGGYNGSAKFAISAETFSGQPFQRGYAARVLIKGGDINNVYGGNDVSGVVYYGSQVEILSDINGDVYGAGNGSYAYTDKASWVTAHPEDADFYYDPSRAATSVEALNLHRPNVEKSWVHVAGTDAAHPTVIGGSLYCGGNSATLRATSGSLTAARAHLQIGSHVIADQVFQGSNGVNMISEDMLLKYANNAFSSLDLTSNAKAFNGGTTTTFSKYMEGVEVAIIPDVAFDANYTDQTARFGSLYCGGNVGSMTADGIFTINFLNKLLIYNKLVGGSNSANVPYREGLNAFHLGGLTGAPGTTGEDKGVKVKLNIAGLKLEPRRLSHPYDPVSGTYGPFSLNEFSYTDGSHTMLAGGNIYGGCYESGYVNGGVTINISENAISDKVASSGVSYTDIQNDVLASTLSIYGGGYGQETEIWGPVTINVTGNGRIMKTYGGGEMGVVGKLQRNATTGEFLTKTVQEWYSETVIENLHGYDTPVTSYKSRPHNVALFADNGTYSTTVNLAANSSTGTDLHVAKLYGGGFQGTVSGNTIVNLGRGRVYDAFGGASNADILGHTEMYIGKTTAPTITHNVYGANDFGGLIVGKEVFYVDNNKDGDHEDTMEKVLTQTYVEYNSGNIAGDLFGGPCGAYHYDDPRFATTVGATGFCYPQLLENELADPMLIPDPEGIREHVGYAANSFVNVISQSNLATDVISGSIFGAGQGLKGAINLADERGSYVRLMSATKNQRTVGELSKRVYGAGYCSNTYRSLVDAYTGYYQTLFGGAHGITYQEVLAIVDNDGHYESNYMGYRSAVRLYDMANNQMDIYGGGANAGAQEAGVVLYGGEARNVYGASFAQGISYAASVEVPDNSTSRVRAIFGGAEGGSDAFPCDAYNTFVAWNSDKARVQDAIYGGNNAFRMTRNSYVAINAPVRNFEDKLTNVFGGGYGPKTVTLYTSIGLQAGAEVANVFGGGNNGQVLDTPSFRYYLDDSTDKPVEDRKIYPAELLGTGYGYQKYLNDSEVIGFHNWIVTNCWKPDAEGNYAYDNHDPAQPLGAYTSNAHGHSHPVYFLSTQMEDMKNTNVFILKGATVAENAYGGGLGDQALVSGETSVHLMGGTVKGDIYGGGYGGNVEEYEHLIFPTDAATRHEITMSATYVDLQGGIARNVYGGGLNGRVTGATHVTLGTKDQHPYDFYGTRVAGQYEHQTYYGDPIVERSLYGGGQMGPVYGTAYLTINQGHVGYKYDATKEVDSNVTVTIDGTPTTVNRRSNADCYVENLDLNDEGDNFLDQNGNAFGAGYGEGASVDVTYVNIYGGTIRNSLYGGGEIAAVGRGTMAVAQGANKKLGTISVAGRTHIYMYNGLVQGDVFGGGRGYSYDLTGNEVVGKTLYTDGYVFGTTDVEIRGGIVGTPETVADGHGNVFGGGNIGYCFSDALKRGVKNGKEPDDIIYKGRYYTNEWECTQCHFHDFMRTKPTVCGKCGKMTNATDDDFLTNFTRVNATPESILSEDCRVVISPYAQVLPGKTISIKGNGTVLPDGSQLEDRTFTAGEYVPTEYLDLLKDKNSASDQWQCLSDAGVTVRNAVFAGGNVSSGSDKVYANAITVFGNATASIADVFFRDLITFGTDHTGGLYGDGNLTFVDGYRELNITNYGTDYYGTEDAISYEDYKKMNDRERAYFTLKYKCVANNSGKEVNAIITQDEYEALDPAYQSESYWTLFGECSITAGRVLNTIQRADFCGVFGSRLVLQGAQDRVPEVVDYTQYTINRVGEVSLNLNSFKGDGKDTMGANIKNHGNYFGMYNIVNYLGALTSDVAFDDVRTFDPVKSGTNNPEYANQTYYDWKSRHLNQRNRNNGTSHNMVALASGVYLELVREPATALPTAEKDYGLITGIVQLDLINVMPGLGGGYVYARNEHGRRDGNLGAHQNLSVYNKAAVNNTLYTYDDNNRQVMETTGNFIHNYRQIVDDCFPGGGQYMDYSHKTGSPAHYWYIRGDIYVYDQYVSAFTGSSNAYSENIELPLTITAGSNGKLSLIDIKQNYYAYTDEDGNKLGSPGAEDKIVVNNITYGLNDVITYWDYMQLDATQKTHFVDETYVTTKDFLETAGGTLVPEGTVMLPSEYEAYLAAHASVWDIENEMMVDTKTFLHPSNAVSHDNGYILTVDMTNPVVWDKWYSNTTGSVKKDFGSYSKLSEGEQKGFLAGPTYYTETAGLYGQRHYTTDEIVTKTTVDAYNDGISKAGAQTGQALVEQAYVSVTAVEYNGKNVQAGVGISATEYATLDAATKTKFAQAYTCTSTFAEDAATGLYIYYGELVSASRYEELRAALISQFKEASTAATDAAKQTEAEARANAQLLEHFDNAYIITTPGLFGGKYFAAGENHRAIDSWSSLSDEDRSKFNFRYDALDALLLANYPGKGEEGPGVNNIQLYDGPYWTGTGTGAEGNGWPNEKIYGANQAIDYTATYTGTTALTDRTGATKANTNDVLDRQDYEALPNEQRHYSRVKIEEAGKTYHIVKESFISGGTAYAAGSVISDDIYNSFDANRKAKVQNFSTSTPGDYFICREAYTIAADDNGTAVTAVNGGASTTIAKGSFVPSGTIINETDYDHLINLQLKDFIIHGNAPIETSTFYVSSGSQIEDLTKDRVITVVYQYKYEEGDESGKNVEEIVERHVINIHITFKSGVPTIGKLQEPSIVLPGETVGLKLPNVTPGAYEILGGGWELFTNEPDAAKHQNGIPYYNNATPMYWYQDGYYVAYYAKTYLGKTYSNSVPFKVANYHDMADVWTDKVNHMYVDHPNVQRNSKIYIDDAIHTVTVESANPQVPADDETTAPTTVVEKSEIDMLYDIFNQSLADKTKVIKVEEQDTDGEGKDLYYPNEEAARLKDKTNLTTEPTAWPATTVKDETVTVYDPHARNLANLDFFLSTDVETKKGDDWEPIGWEDAEHPEQSQCFMGTLHGMGYTISGLTKSLFGELCGYVYNLGVTGSFTKSGVADRVKTADVPDSADPERDIPATQIHGFVTNSWIYTDAAPEAVALATGNPAASYLPVVGEPNDIALGVQGIHVLNCFFPEECGYPMGILSRGPNTTANSAALRSFNNGEVTYDLNGFYLNKRYSDAAVTKADYDALTGAAALDKATYHYWTQAADGSLNADYSTGYYLGGGSMHAYRGENLGYVERLFADGDFIYKYGNIPLESNERWNNTLGYHLPIWPDDYYFFGQQLTYGYDETERPYQPLPAHARKTIAPDGGGKDGRLEKEEKNNVVFRAPAYFRSSEKGMAHFNPHAVFADRIADDYGVDNPVLDGRDVHPGLTALDFTGFNDRAIMLFPGTDHQKFQAVPNTLAFSNGARNISGRDGYDPVLYSVINDGAYFGPITDYSVLTGFKTYGITQNLLTYAPTTTYSEGTKHTLKVLQDYYNEPEYADYYSGDYADVDGHTYRTVQVLDASHVSSIRGHLVQKENSADLARHYYYAATDHFLVDRQDFNAPIEYEFHSRKLADGTMSDYRMWYQRTPDNYAGYDAEGKVEGWEAVCLPFSAELVSTQTKGEITHFYNTAIDAPYTPGYTSGHEYWLREFTGTNSRAEDDAEITTALMNYPVAEAGPAKVVTNTFLWDYYYNADGKDANGDDYRYDENNEDTDSQPSRKYYSQARSYDNYPLSTPGRPYIVGFPGSRYYEFDLSGTFVPEHSGTITPDQLTPQTVSFVSAPAITIRVSDDELSHAGTGTVTHDGFTFYGNYLNVQAESSYYLNVTDYNIAKGTDLTEADFAALTMAQKRKTEADYNFYVLNDRGSAFDATTAPTTVAAFRPYFATEAAVQPKTPASRSIVFGMGGATQFEPDDETIDASAHGLAIYAKKNKIIVESTLETPKEVRIATAAGQVITTFTIEPGERVTTRTTLPGIYVVNTTKVLVE